MMMAEESIMLVEMALHQANVGESHGAERQEKG
jgi:hypothetical protein